MGRVGKVDPESQEELWETIRETRKNSELDIGEDGAVNGKPNGRRLRIVCISDTHCEMGEMIEQGLIPDGDILIHAGDITTFGDEPSLLAFNEQLASLPHPHKLVIAGNHELGFDPSEDESLRAAKYQGKGTPNGASLLTNCTFLQDNYVIIEGVKFYGSTWHPLPGYPFSLPRSQLAEKWENIPEDVDVLITHSPPLGYRDVFPPNERWGCYGLLQKVEEVKPVLHVFGHVHACYGASSNGSTTFLNAASEKATKDGFNKPIVYYFPLERE